MRMAELISREAVFFGLDAHSKKHAVQEISALCARLTGLPERAVFDTLLQRERLGSTGVGNGIAIPHGKLKGFEGIFGAFFKLAEPVEFEAPDDAPVDLIFVILAPEDAGADHLKALAKIARVMRMPEMAEDLRAATSAAELHTALTRTAAPAA